MRGAWDWALAARSARLVFLAILKMWIAQELELSGNAAECAYSCQAERNLYEVVTFVERIVMMLS
jgi:hypothetical protein